jgi:hypothetical protein
MLGSVVNNSKHVRTFTQAIHFIICVFFHAGKELMKLFSEQILYFTIYIYQISHAADTNLGNLCHSYIYIWTEFY